MSRAHRDGAPIGKLRIRTIRHVSIVETGGRVIRVAGGWQAIAHGHRIGTPQYDRMVAQRFVTEFLRPVERPAPDYDSEWDIWTDAATAYYEDQIWSDE